MSDLVSGHKDSIEVRVDSEFKSLIGKRAADNKMTVSDFVRHSLRTVIVLEDLGAFTFFKSLEELMAIHMKTIAMQAAAKAEPTPKGRRKERPEGM